MTKKQTKSTHVQKVKCESATGSKWLRMPTKTFCTSCNVSSSEALVKYENTNAQFRVLVPIACVFASSLPATRWEFDPPWTLGLLQQATEASLARLLWNRYLSSSSTHQSQRSREEPAEMQSVWLNNSLMARNTMSEISRLGIMAAKHNQP